MVQAANSTTLETATVTFASSQYFVAQFSADGAFGSGTPDAMLPGNPYADLQVGSSISCLRSGTNQTDSANRPVITRVSFVNPTANAALAGNVAAANRKANAKPLNGTYTVTTADVSAGASTIATSLVLGSVIVQIMRSGKVATSDAQVSTNSGSILVSSGSSYTLTAGDVVNFSGGGV